MREFKITRDPHEEKEYLYKKSKIILEPGLTVLVGCNGAGKSTLLKTLKYQLNKQDIPVIMFDNLVDGGSRARSRAAFFDDFSFVASSMISSEGENIKLNISRFASQLGYFCLTEHKNDPEVWILLDAVDSGLSIDNVVEIKEQLFATILENKQQGQDIYIVISANEYELARGEKCFDVQDCKYREFKTYEAFRKFILKSRQKRDSVIPQKRKE